MFANLEEELKEFHSFVGKLTAERPRTTPQMALALWRAHLDEAAAIQKGIDDVNRGATRPIDEVLLEIDEKFSLNAPR